MYSLMHRKKRAFTKGRRSDASNAVPATNCSIAGVVSFSSTRPRSPRKGISTITKQDFEVKMERRRPIL
jgi:hypothetical protein